MKDTPEAKSMEREMSTEKNWGKAEAEVKAEKKATVYARLGGKCPACLETLARPLKPGESAHAMPRPIDLHMSKKAPGEVECPNCGETFPIEKPKAPEPEPAAKKKTKAE